MKREILIFISIFLVFFFGCKKDDINTSEIEQPSFSKKTFIAEKPVGLQNSTDPVAIQCGAFFDNINAVLYYISLLEVPDDAELVDKNLLGEKTWSWENDSTTCWMTFTKSLRINEWTLELEYSDVGRDTYIWVGESKDNSEGQVTIGSDASMVDIEHISYTWYYENEELHIEVSDFNGVGYIILATVNSDNSGSYKYYIAGTLYYDVTWNADNTGNYTYYDFLGNVWNGSW